MENNSDSDEPEKKRPHLNSFSSAMARSSNPSPPNDHHNVDAAVLQYQNQMMLQQIDKQKHQLQDLEANIKELKAKQGSYDDMLIAVNQLWNQLVDDVALLGACAGAGQNALQILDSADYSRGLIPSCPAEQMFLCRILQRDTIEANNVNEVANFVEEALTLRHTSTRELMKLLEHTITVEREKTENIARTLNGKITSEDAIIELSKIDDMIEREANNLHQVIDILHLKHKEYADVIHTRASGDSTDQSEIRRITGDLDDSMAELEESRRKLVNLKMQKDVASGMHNLPSGAVNGTLSPEKSTERTISLQELKNSIDETKILAASRLSEIQEAKEENLALSKELQDFQNEVKDEKYVHSSRLYTMLNDQLQHWNAEVERYKALTGSLQADRAVIMRREKELYLKAESAEAVRTMNENDSRIEELELQLQKCVIEKNDLEISMEEAVQNSGRKDITSEFHVMSSSLSKEMEMMETQLKQWKETAHETLSLREKSQTLKASLSTKTNERNGLASKCAVQMIEIKSLKELIEKLQKEKLELQIFLDLYAQESYGNRDLSEIKESEHRAHSQADMFKNALDEHSLELRVKAANEAEAACQQRLAATEAEITDSRAKLDASERDFLELTEAIKIKDKEAEAYISEIETIGQAYEDMQTQNQHLLQLVTERDDYNIKLVSESVKTKQAQSFLVSEKQALAKQLQQVNTSVESLKMRISQDDEQMKAVLAEALKSTEEDRHLSVNLEAGKWELADADKELQWLKYAVASSEKEYGRIKKDIEDIQLELDNERSLRKNIEEELHELNSRVAEMSSETGEAAIQKLQSEIKFYKNILQCSVCTDRPKEVVIVKCFHLFCNYCVQKNLEIRHRKCPACGTPFGQSDIRFVKI
ncbi:PREDICTED: E3 ubiquitin-protein ligase BRE1-like 2 [Fragaria vesca subsp. vesca]|uniref:E3 ubiquitin-protein ligase BRE1-like 2 n=1 Tax=Fragaria vesca subsp. vesca TaxID=101020 RepID=UPI0002C32806|nr:PREDICTED: E3 ubiquitin-protein ligase BRE1-like 2 [Fragaria vesca subsp. vesca]